VIKNLLTEVDELVIAIGSAQHSHTPENLFTTGERLVMLKSALEEAGVDLKRCWLVPIPDVNSHPLWVAQVVAYSPKFDVVYSNNPLVQELFKRAGFKVKSTPVYDREVLAAKEIRRRALLGEDWRELVPKSVAKFIDEVKGFDRLRRLMKSEDQ
jgi:nicotinamide-nucleotide adenylyltransferase